MGRSIPPQGLGERPSLPDDSFQRSGPQALENALELKEVHMPLKGTEEGLTTVNPF